MKGKVKYLIVVLVVLQGILLFTYVMFYQSRGYSASISVVHTPVGKKDVVTNRDQIKQLIQPKLKSKQAGEKKDVGVQVPNKTIFVDERNGECNGTKFQYEHIDDTSWFPVDKGNSMFVFSAYYIKARRKVFIIGAKQKSTQRCICQFWYPYGSKGNMRMTEHPALSKMRSEGKSKLYLATVFECFLGADQIPSYISLVTRSCETPLNMLAVKNVSKPIKYKTRFSVCLSPLYFNYSRAYELVEWIELNRILGAEKFTIYNISTSINVDKVLEYYSKRGLVEIVQWRLPMRVSKCPGDQSDIHYFGQTAALNDCLFRTKRDSEYLVNVDLDEFIIPHGENLFNWTLTIKPYENIYNVFMFKSTYFRKEWKSIKNDFPEQDQAEKYKLVSLKVIEREGRIFPAKRRTKYIARTASIDVIQIHEVPGSHTAIIPPSVALLHHYRNWFNQLDRNGSVEDNIVRQLYGTQLINRVRIVWNDLHGVQMEL
ncbi:uncharacterized protein LOC132725993 [Ruditapes philippinarum]|uniref:uncharacterized protein LOC132725993 n=1 Tax=Ruditapes philippinarum TaxID=129788 RepID=UPI00295BCBC0|nr:uncharacterized protein LOC132725993 [Ruditapes philippinarum]